MPTRNYCNAWTYQSTCIELSRKEDYVARACYMCGLYRECWGESGGCSALADRCPWAAGIGGLTQRK